MKINLAILFATVELLGDMHGDWDKAKVQVALFLKTISSTI